MYRIFIALINDFRYFNSLEAMIEFVKNSNLELKHSCQIKINDKWEWMYEILKRPS